jgi:predicted transcriptional regulator
VHEVFVDHAEEIWRMVDEGKMQQVIADEMGWSRTAVANYVVLEKISPIVWSQIVTAISKDVTKSKNNGVTNSVTVVTENLLRNILDLTEYHQLEIINGGIADREGSVTSAVGAVEA